ncbi:MAG TPA: FG-GAP-like repeat-containing protein, partial [Candidatus Brocadiia bacterium]|nr:FG-GAP-like repeat-containing protein [Candidatus Brocadiia bacterium]
SDFNNDGNSDLATANSGSNNVSVLLGDGAGGFGANVNYAVGTGPYSVFSADFNGDGNADLATANRSGSNNVSVLLGDGAGGFGANVNYAVGTGPHSVFSADFNNDGNSDLATANFSSNNVSVLLGQSQALADGVHPMNVTFTDIAGNTAASGDSTTIDTDSPEIAVNGWQTAVTHGNGVGEIVTTMADGYVESRYAGIRKLLITLDETIAGNVTPGDLNIIGVSHGDQSGLISGMSAAGGILTVNLSAPLPDVDTYTISLLGGVKDLAGNSVTGDADLSVVVLRGDANGDGMVNSFDLLNIRAQLHAAITADTARYDINGDGHLDTFDMLMARVYVGNKVI